MKELIKPSICGSMAAIGLMLILCIGRNIPTFTWPQVALIVGVAMLAISMTWIIRRLMAWGDANEG